MSVVTRTTQPLDAEIQLPDKVAYSTLAMQTALYKAWQGTFVSPNPLAAQVNFFKALVTKIKNREINVEFYSYWYKRVKQSHPVVIENLPKTEYPEYQDINESVGNTYFNAPDANTTAIQNMGSASIKPYPTNIESLLPDAHANLLVLSYNKVNTQYITSIGNIQTSPSAAPTDAHGVSLVKDTVSNTRNDTAKPLIKAALEQKYGVTLDLTEIKNTVKGDISISFDEFSTDVEGTKITVDVSGDKIVPTLSTLTTKSLQVQ